MRKVCKWEACEKYRQGSQKSYQAKRESRGDEEVKPEEARDILSDMRDQHLQFVDGAENTGSWGENFLKEAWACDFGEKALEKQIPMKPNNIKSILDFSGRYYTTKGNCPVCNSEGLYKADIYCNKCGQKLDWGEENGR